MPKRSDNQMNFTKESVAGIPPAPEGKRVTYVDTRCPGLELRVTDKGVKSFSVRGRVKGGGQERFTIGTFPKITVAQARELAGEQIASWARGVSVTEQIQRRRSELSLDEFFAEYLARHAKPNKRTWSKDEGDYKLHLSPVVGRRKLSAVARADLALIHSGITKKGSPAVANRILALVSSMYSRAIEWGFAETNPAKGIRRNRENSRDRFLEADELPWFFNALAEEPNTDIRDFVLLALLTGARRSNVLAMRWEDVNLDAGVWRIPGEVSKNGEVMRLPLSAEAVEVLRERSNVDSPFVFPGPGKKGHIAEPKYGWERILTRATLARSLDKLASAGIDVDRNEMSDDKYLQKVRQVAAENRIDVSQCSLEGLWMHDLRRTLGSWQAGTGASLILIGKSLGHRTPQATAVYARLQIDPVREAVSRATSAMLTAGGLSSPATVSEIRKKAS